MGNIAGTNPIFAMGFLLPLFVEKIREVFIMANERKVQIALKRFLKNDGWREEYENAPTEQCKRHMALIFYRSVFYDADDYKEEKEALEASFGLEDWKYLYRHAGKNPFKLLCKRKIRELEIKQELKDKTVYEYYQLLCEKADNALRLEDFDLEEELSKQAVEFRNECFTKQDWERAIEETPMAVGKVALKRMMNERFPQDK